MFNKIKKNGRPSKVNDELIRLDLPSNNHDDGANNKKRKLEIRDCVGKSQ